MARALYQPSDDDCAAMIEHLRYEVEQMRLALALIQEQSLNDERGLWLLSEAGLVHARNIMEFLFFPPFDVDDRQRGIGIQPTASAGWFLSRSKWDTEKRRRLFEEQYGVPVRELKRRIDRRVFHLALDRDLTPRVHFHELAEHLETSLRSFLFHMPGHWREQMG